MFIHEYKVYDRGTGDRHDITILFSYTEKPGYCEKHYTVLLDHEVVSVHPTIGKAQDAAVDIVIDNNYCAIKPIEVTGKFEL